MVVFKRSRKMDVVNGTALTKVTMESAGMVCYAPRMITSKGAWMGDNPLKFSVPLFLLQLIVIISTSRLLHILLKPFRQPRAISEILVCTNNTHTHRYMCMYMHNAFLHVFTMSENMIFAVWKRKGN